MTKIYIKIYIEKQKKYYYFATILVLYECTCDPYKENIF